jgi:hypothetical protein
MVSHLQCFVTDCGLNLSPRVMVLEQCGVDRCGCGVSTFTHGVTCASPYPGPKGEEVTCMEEEPHIEVGVPEGHL